MLNFLGKFALKHLVVIVVPRIQIVYCYDFKLIALDGSFIFVLLILVNFACFLHYRQLLSLHALLVLKFFNNFHLFRYFYIEGVDERLVLRVQLADDDGAHEPLLVEHVYEQRTELNVHGLMTHQAAAEDTELVKQLLRFVRKFHNLSLVSSLQVATVLAQQVVVLADIGLINRFQLLAHVIAGVLGLRQLLRQKRVQLEHLVVLPVQLLVVLL